MSEVDQNIRKAFEENYLLPIGGVSPSRVKSASCFWGNPDFEGPKINFKHDLQREYKDNPMMTTLCKLILKLLAPSWDDLLHELVTLQGQHIIDFEHIENIYAYMFHTFSTKKANWNIIKYGRFGLSFKLPMS